MKLKHLFYAAAVSTLAAACGEADELSSGILSEKTLDAIHSGTDRFATRVNLNSEWRVVMLSEYICSMQEQETSVTLQ